MTETFNQIVNETKNLSALERVQLVEEMYKTFESEKEETMTRRWADESERRIDAFERGEITTIDYEDITKILQ
ncbi:MAG: addiction module protein [Ignavibacteriae bacterium]|nr:addiction module protein [Ignavibacteriota bacterium]